MVRPVQELYVRAHLDLFFLSRAGVEVVLYLKTMHVLLYAKTHHKKGHVFYVVFSTVMLVMITTWVSTQAIFGEKMWIEDASFPGGPDAYWAANVSVWYMDLGTAAITILQLMTDGLMVRSDRHDRATDAF